MVGGQLRRAVATAVMLIAVTGSSTALLTSALYLWLKAIAKDEAGLAFSFVILSPSVALFFMASLGLGLYVPHGVYRRTTVPASGNQE